MGVINPRRKRQGEAALVKFDKTSLLVLQRREIATCSVCLELNK
jgi:hypothetical protein